MIATKIAQYLKQAIHYTNFIGIDYKIELI